MNRPEHSPDSEAAKVRKIIDHIQLHQITERLFARLPIHIVENNQKNAVRALGYSHPHLEIFHQLPPGPSRTLLLVKDDHSMMLECSVVSRSERGTEFVKPLRLFLSKRGIRHENRVAVSGSDLAGQVRNVIPHPEFYRVNAMSNPARDQLFSQYATALRGLIPETVVKIELQKTNRLSVRMKKLQDFNLPTFAPDMMRQRQGDEQSVIAMPHSELEQVLRADGLPGDFMGEICEPLRYRDAFIVGYVQVLSTRAPLTVQQYHSVRQLVRRLERDLDQKRCFPENPITGKILDISHSGIGFLYTGQRNILSSAGVADKIVFDAHFSVENIATFSGRIMNMTSLENGRRYGIEFEHVSESGQKALRQMIEGDY
jgi:hypothetical protein